MSDEKKRKIPMPAIAIALIVVGVVLAERILVPRAPEPPSATPPTPNEIATAPDEPEAEPPTEGPTEPLPPVGPIVTPVSATWSTFHGGPSLTGLSDAQLPAAPEVLWRFQADGALYYTPVADDAGIYVNTLRGRVYALDFAGNERWSQTLTRKLSNGNERPERLDAPIACFLSTVFVPTLDGTLYALDAANGAIKWTYAVEGPILGSPNLYTPEEADAAPQLFVIGQEDGTLHSINPITGERIWQADAIDRCDGSASISDGNIVYGSCAAAFHVFSAKDGALQKNIELDADSQVASGAAVAGDSIYAGAHSGYFFHASISTGKVLWTNQDSGDEIFSTPALSEKLVIFASYDGNVYALDRFTGKQAWIFESGGYPSAAVIAGDKVVLGLDGVLHLLALDTGESLWSHEISDEIASPAIINGMILVNSEDGTVTAFGLKTPGSQTPGSQTPEPASN